MFAALEVCREIQGELIGGEAEWKKNFQMDRQTFMEVAVELQLNLQPNRSPRSLDVLSVEKQLGINLYYLKNQPYDDS